MSSDPAAMHYLAVQQQLDDGDRLLQPRPKSAGRTRNGARRRSSLQIVSHDEREDFDDDMTAAGVVVDLDSSGTRPSNAHRQVARAVSDSLTRRSGRASDAETDLVDDVGALGLVSPSTGGARPGSRLQPSSSAPKAAGFDILELLSARQRVLERYDNRTRFCETLNESAASSHFDCGGGGGGKSTAKGAVPASSSTRRASYVADGRQTRLEPLQMMSEAGSRRQTDWIQQQEPLASSARDARYCDSYASGAE